MKRPTVADAISAATLAVIGGIMLEPFADAIIRRLRPRRIKTVTAPPTPPTIDRATTAELLNELAWRIGADA